MTSPAQPPWHDRVVGDTRRWLERAVIGLNLCPFAKAVHVKAQIRFAVSAATSPEDILRELDDELQRLAAADPQTHETTLLIVPLAFEEFLDFSVFLPRCDKRVRRLGLEGQIQVASFHPRYCFADAQEDDMANFTNRSPYPILHLLREESIAKAVGAYPEPETIYEANMRRLQQLGRSGWHALGVGPT